MDALLLIIGLVVLTAGAEILVKGGASLARRLGVTPLVVGLTVIAFGTSTPELVVSVNSAIKEQGDIAVGNVVGSNIFNIAFILGLAAMIAPIRVKPVLLKLDAPVMVAVSFFAVALLYGGSVSRPVGAVLVLLLAAYTIFIVRLARRQAGRELQGEFDEGVPHETKSLVRDIMLIAGGLGLLIGGSDLFLGSAVALARRFGVEEAVIGLTIVAAGTSMPELATSLVAAARKQADISVGNIIGSNIFNVLGILGAASVVRPLSAPGISDFDLWVMAGYSVALLPLLWTGRVLQRWEGLLLFGGYIAYVWWLWPAG